MNKKNAIILKDMQKKVFESDITINPWISTRAYSLNQISSISYLFDEKKHLAFILKDNISLLWEKISKIKNYSLVLDYAKKNNLEDKLLDLLFELQKNEIIKIDVKFNHNSNKYLVDKISKHIPNYAYFERIQKNILIENSYLPELQFIMNHNCNLNCKHCFIHNEQKEKNEQLSFDNAKKIIDEAYLNGIYSVVLTGGECTINKDFLKIAKYIRQLHLQLHILTNSQEFFDNPNLLDEIISIYPSSVQISLYSTNPETHDEITQKKGSHQKTVNVIEKLVKNNIFVNISCFQTSYNYLDYKEVENYAKEIGADFETGNKFIYDVQNNNELAKIKNVDIEKYFLENIDKINIVDNFKKGNNKICLAGIKRLCVTPNLDILPCIYFNYKLGNYKDISITKLRKEIIPEFSKIFTTENLKECFKYDYCKHCVYCPKYCKDFLKKSNILCESAKAYQKAYLYLMNNKKK